MTAPPYPRIPHLSSKSAATPDDRVLDAQSRNRLLGGPVLIEEKLDGSNVMIWLEDGVPRVGMRGGPDTMDRSGERGRVRGWAAQRADELRAGLGERYVVYAEWLGRTHGIRYEALPGPIVGLDVLDRETERFLEPAERDAVLDRIGVSPPPALVRGRASLEDVRRCVGSSRYGAARGEGVIVRTLAPDADVPRIAKLVDAGFVPSPPGAAVTTMSA